MAETLLQLQKGLCIVLLKPARRYILHIFKPWQTGYHLPRTWTGVPIVSCWNALLLRNVETSWAGHASPTHKYLRWGTSYSKQSILKCNTDCLKVSESKETKVSHHNEVVFPTTSIAPKQLCVQKSLLLSPAKKRVALTSILRPLLNFSVPLSPFTNITS